MGELLFKNMYKVYPGDVTAVEDFNLKIEDKEFIDYKLVNELPPKDRADTIKLALDKNRVHLFDTETELRII